MDFPRLEPQPLGNPGTPHIHRWTVATSEVMTLDEAQKTAKNQNFAIPPEELIATWIW